MASEIDQTLYSVEKMMKLLIIGDNAELQILCDRFLEANGYSIGDADNQYRSRTIVNEAYNIAYSMKVLLR